ncbi:hypothetical protein ACFP1C_06100 [Levilactobacillus fujinensis]|uniref:Uncharacterized protein n=1 Tax=Levilactobacillus fujinensis TaxID=2486024 RepID=A0ABW1TEX1_9LACO
MALCLVELRLTAEVESSKTHIMTVVTTILGLKLGNVVQPSPYRPADMG